MEARKLSVGALGSYQPRRLALLLSRFPAQSREAMELPRLRYFVAVGQAQNFTKAAMRLHLAQLALSRQVSDLEDELGVDLLKRTSHGVVLTAEGKLFLEAARGVDIQTIWPDCIQRRKPIADHE